MSEQIFMSKLKKNLMKWIDSQKLKYEISSSGRWKGYAWLYRAEYLTEIWCRIVITPTSFILGSLSSFKKGGESYT